MAAACIPVVIKKGGIKEIIEDKVNGYFWQDINQLVKITKNICEVQQKQTDIIENAQKRAQNFSKETFFKNIEKLLESSK